MNRVGLVLKQGKAEAADIARDLIAWLGNRGCEVFVSQYHADLGARVVAEEELARQIELLVVLGGDGTLLHAAGLVGERRIPLLGVNLGTLGFLTQFDPPQAKEALEHALDATLALEERMRLCVEHAGTTRYALNDAVVSKSSSPKLLSLRATLDDQPITVYKADGLIVATPTGSTAYSLAAGGPILTPQDAMALTPICPHTLTHRPLVVPGQARVRVSLDVDSAGAALSVDGQTTASLGPGDGVLISRAKTPLLLYRSKKTTFEILREKLKWGERESKRTC